VYWDTEYAESDGASLANPDPALSAGLVQGHLEITIQGASAIRRIFPVVPDSMRLIRHLGAGAEDEVFKIPVRRTGQ
jgi:hypothetical protein